MSQSDTLQDAAGETGRTGGSRFRILVCIDGTDESYNTLRYAAKLGHGVDADIVLLYIRPVDKGSPQVGFELDLEHDNVLLAHQELPGVQHLFKGRDLLIELGEMGPNWAEHPGHMDVAGDPLGDNKVEYTSEFGKKVVLKLKAATDIATAILEQWEMGRYDLIMLGESAAWRGMAKSLWDPAVAEKVVSQAPCSVLVARGLEIDHGHLICIDGSERSTDAMLKEARLASKCNSPITLMSVAVDHEDKAHADKVVAEGLKLLKHNGIEVVDTIVRTGDPVEEIIEEGTNNSVIAVAESGKSRMQRFFKGSVAFKVMTEAHNSVMIVR
jgi:nucleotide-binding universal stress UspA family protein